MKVKEIIALNNQKRKELTDDNLKHYEDMLTYIRLASNKSEQQTEEILLELLEHTLQAQDENRTVKDVFGDDLKHYCQDLIEEIPSETHKKQISFSLYIIFGFLTMASLTYGVLGFVLSLFFDSGSGTTTFSIGSSIMIVFLNMIIAFLFIAWLLSWMKSSVFKEKKTNKWIEFFQIWFGFMLSFGLFLIIAYFMPDFGPALTMNTLWFIAIAVVLYIISRLFKN